MCVYLPEALELNLQVGVWYPMWGLETEPLKEQYSLLPLSQSQPQICYF